MIPAWNRSHWMVFIPHTDDAMIPYIGVEFVKALLGHPAWDEFSEGGPDVGVTQDPEPRKTSGAAGDHRPRRDSGSQSVAAIAWPVSMIRRILRRDRRKRG